MVGVYAVRGHSRLRRRPHPTGAKRACYPVDPEEVLAVLHSQQFAFTALALFLLASS